MAPQNLSRRAQVTVNGWAGILIIVILVCTALFCIGIVFLICRSKRARKQRQQKLIGEQEAPVAQSYNAHEYRMVELDGEDVEMGPAELQGGVAGDARMKPQLLDGYVAPAAAAYDGRVVEMPAQTVTR